jgi:transposase, IS5 family
MNDCNERIVRHGLNVIRDYAANVYDDEDGSHEGKSGTAADQQTRSDTRKPNQGSFLIDATCSPAQIRHPTSLSLLNEARELTETLIDKMHSHVRESFEHRHRTHHKQAR